MNGSKSHQRDPPGPIKPLGMAMPTLDVVENLLMAHPCQFIPLGQLTPTAVALILHNASTGLEVLFIERARHEGDPWSGNLGFPGGKVEKYDWSARHAVERETSEEIGLDLASGRYLGRLSDITGAHLPVLVSCFVFALAAPPRFLPSDEISSIFWVPMDQLLDPQNHRTARVRFAGKELDTPAINIPGQPDTPLWGITYRLIMQFFAILGVFPSAPPSKSAFPSRYPEK